MECSISSQNPNFSLRMATPEDAPLIVIFMKRLGKYQKMEDAIIATPERIKNLLNKGLGKAVFGMYKDKIISFAYFHLKSSAFTGKKGLYIDGFFVDEHIRNEGIGKITFQYLAKYSIDKSCEFLEWGCLDWNISAIRFYEKLGAYCINNMRIYRLSPETLAQNAQEFAKK